MESDQDVNLVTALVEKRKSGLAILADMIAVFATLAGSFSDSHYGTVLLLRPEISSERAGELPARRLAALMAEKDSRLYALRIQSYAWFPERWGLLLAVALEDPWEPSSDCDFLLELL